MLSVLLALILGLLVGAFVGIRVERRRWNRLIAILNRPKAEPPPPEGPSEPSEQMMAIAEELLGYAETIQTTAAQRQRLRDTAVALDAARAEGWRMGQESMRDDLRSAVDVYPKPPPTPDAATTPK